MVELTIEKRDRPVLRPRKASWLVAVVAASMLAFFAVPVEAQEVDESEPVAAGFHLSEQVLPLAEGFQSGTELAVWPEGRLGYHSAGFVNATPKATAGGPDGGPLDARFATNDPQLVAVDLDTFQEVARTDPAETRRLNYPVGHSAPLAIDGERHRIYAPHFDASDDRAVNQALCGPGVTDVCLAGIYVLDARTLRKVDEFSFSPIGVDLEGARPDGVGVQLTLLDLRYSAPRGPDDRGKVHALVQERLHYAVNFLNPPTSFDPRTRTSFHWAVQFDADTGAVDWVERVEACSGREGDTSAGLERHHGTIFRGPDIDDPVVWVGCFGSGFANGWVVALDLADEPDLRPRSQRRFPGPSGTLTFRSDPDSQRIVIKSILNHEEAWWVFDGETAAFLGKLGLGSYRPRKTIAGLDPGTGRFYVLAPAEGGEPGGLYYTDLRRRKLAQFVRVTALGELVTNDDPFGRENELPIAVDPASDTRARRLFVRPFAGSRLPPHYHVIVDTTPVTIDAPSEAPSGDRTVDVPERDDATLSRYSGQGRGYGFRTILVGGLDGIHNNAPIDHDYFVKGITRRESSCTSRTREFVFGLAGSDAPDRTSRLDHTGSATAQARPMYIDPQTQADLEAAFSRCGTQDAPSWEELTEGARVRGLDEPGLFLQQLDTAESECAAPDRTQHSSGDTTPIAELRSSVVCRSGELIEADSSVRAVSAGPVRVAEARSTVHVAPREDGGITATVRSWTRGIDITGDAGTVHIDSVHASAETVANGRAQPDGLRQQPNCDPERTAGTCLRRSITGVEVLSPQGVFRCDVCTAEDTNRQMVDAMQAALGTSWAVGFRSPDEGLAAGSDDGYLAAIQKSDVEREPDKILNHDLLPTLPALQLVRVNNGARTPGRQIYQFAGVEAATTYGITCLLVVQDGECTAEAASLRIELEDTDGQALSGGVFEVQADADGDGTISLEESTAPARTCVTGADGSCELDPIAAGSYVVHQALAPTGFAPSPDTPVALPPGGQGLIEVVNGRLATTGLRINLTDAAAPPQPLAGGAFEVHADDGDAALGSGDVLLATCTTGANGTCPFELAIADSVLTGTSVAADDPRLLIVPPGPYVIHQSVAPDGYAPIDDVAFTLPEGQIADANFQNGQRSEEAAPTEPTVEPPSTSTGVGEVPPEQPPVAIAPPAPAPPPVVTVNVPDVAAAPTVAPPATQPSTVVRVLQAPAAAARLLLRSPLEAAAFGGVLLLFAAAGAGAWRRRLLLDLLSN